MEHASLTKEIIGSGMKVHGVLGPGFVEVVYRNALAHDLHKHGLSFERERHLTVLYDGIIVGDFSADFLVEGLVLIDGRFPRRRNIHREPHFVFARVGKQGGRGGQRRVKESGEGEQSDEVFHGFVEVCG